MQLQVTAYPRENALRLGIGSGRTSKHTHTHIYGLLQSFYATLFHIISYFVLLQLLPCPPPQSPARASGVKHPGSGDVFLGDRSLSSVVSKTSPR